MGSPAAGGLVLTTKADGVYIIEYICVQPPMAQPIGPKGYNFLNLDEMDRRRIECKVHYIPVFVGIVCGVLGEFVHGLKSYSG